MQAVNAARAALAGFVGNLGHKNRIDFTVLGDMVNTIFRISGGVPPWALRAGVETVKACGQNFSWRKMSPLNLKGKEKPVEVQELKIEL